ncbi:biotin carboxyl carrier protein [Natranaerovirga hydrolytica]|uniref:Biotin carboxyl carrier protein of acetyl-CoA carboxylase n=1 Tax=Natranaerovirga hydrolytica TaxID=680378 RepID=A0A4R1M9W5_9FIRM|nr:acetyl-CoA carboxylase biotin carboxyl carrier protein [Natranaerovirga hydrolytica]TCK86739.1 biotin carboxyl carrier protein [Natranaerovirga hydrolytica]
MEFNQVLELMKAFSESNIHNLKYEHKDFKLKLNKEPVNKEIIVSEEALPVQKNQVVTSEVGQNTTSNQQKEDHCKIVKSPIVGTFYSSSSPEANDYVQVGSQVKKGQVLCIIEAMKLMNEIESEFDGEVVEILVENEQMVEYGQPLFKIK